MFGGATGSPADNATADALSTVYILTLPAFAWIETSAVAPIYRADHTCSVIGNRQMISIGGVPDRYPNADNWTDPWNGLQILDMTELVWTDTFKSGAAAYEPPTPVTEYYKTNSWYPAS